MTTIELIRAEIERRKKENMYVDLLISIGRYYEDRDLLSFLDTIPDEPVSDDEKIRKEIIHYILYEAKGVSEEQEHAWIAYLEKQKEQKPAEWRDRLKDEIKHLKIDVYDQSHQFDLGARSSLTFLESFIDSLTQEQPENDSIRIQKER